MDQGFKSSSPAFLAWKKFTRNTTGMISLSFIVLSIIIALTGYLITPDKSPNANMQLLEISTMKPGFRVSLLKPAVGGNSESTGFFRKMFFGLPDKRQIIPIRSYKIIGDSLHAVIYDPDSTSLSVSFHLLALTHPGASDIKHTDGQFSFKNAQDMPETKSREELIDDIHKNCLSYNTYWLGTDQFGRDMLSRLIIGTRVSLSVGFISVLISLIIGISVGSIGGYFGGRTDDFVVWLINVVWSLPTLLLVIAITFALGKGFWQVFIAVGLTMWVEVARIVRGQIIPLREKEYIEAGRALGYSNLRIISRHVVPNILSPVIVISAANFASAILIEAGLSFLGLGVQPPVPSWGSMIKENYAYIILDSAYLAILPGLAIMFMVMAFMLVGNALRDALDVRLQGSDE